VIKLKDILLEGISLLRECIITHSIIDTKVIMAKNRDRAYTAKLKIVRELVGEVEIVYILDDDTDWSEGMNSAGIGLVNSALMVDADEKEKKKIKKGGRPSEDGLKIRKALMYTTLAQAIKSIVKFTGKDEAEVGVKGHTFVANKDKSFAIEMTSKQGPAIVELDRGLGHVRTNHGYAYSNAGYTSGQSKNSSQTRWDIAQKVLQRAKTPTDVLDGLSGYYPVDMRNNPYRNVDKVKNKTKKDVLSTTGQLLMNLTDLELLVRMDSTKSEWLGVDDRTPDYYKPKIKIKVEYVKTKKIG
tara:strand:- start:276 stop:1172 length:897 start_codon:yes stop_codon:yes gene_type:complete